MSNYKNILFLCALTTIVPACAFDTSGFDDISCEEEGAQQDGRLCQDGYWQVIDETTTPDQSQADQGTGPEDMTEPALDTDLPDQALPVDMRTTQPDMNDDVDMGNMPDADMTTRPEDMTPDMPGTPEDMGPADMNPDDDMGPVDMGTPVDCPTTTQEQCAALAAEVNTPDACFDLNSERQLANGCTLPAGLSCDCQEADDVCTIANGQEQGTCNQACVPESDADYCARVQNQSPNTNICGTRFTALDNCAQPRQNVACNFCDATESCMNDNAPSTCACVPKNIATLCQEAFNPCGNVSVDNGCGTQVELVNCSACSAYETCEANPNPTPNSAANICQPLAVQPLPLPPQLANDAMFGFSLSTQDDWLAVGAPKDTVTNTDNQTHSCGAVHMYKFEQGKWVWKQKVEDARGGICNNGAEEFGYSIDLLDQKLLIGSPGDGNAGRAHLFALDNNGLWQREATFGPGQDISTNQYSDDSRIGHSVALSPEINNTNGDFRFAIGAPMTNLGSNATSSQNAGVTYSVRRYLSNMGNDPDYFTDLRLPSAQDNMFMGTAVDFLNASTFSVGAPGYQSTTSGGGLYAYYLNQQNQWQSFQGSPFTAFFFDPTGTHGQGELASAFTYSNDRWNIIGAPGYISDRGRIYIADLTQPGAYIIAHTNLDTGDAFGYSIAAFEDQFITGAPGDNGATNSSSQTGAAYIYTWTGQNWAEDAVVRIPNEPSGAMAGSSVALLQDWAFMGAPDQQKGQVYVINRLALP